MTPRHTITLSFLLCLMVWCTKADNPQLSCKTCYNCNNQGHEMTLTCCSDLKACFAGIVPVCKFADGNYDQLPWCTCKSGFAGEMCNSTCLCSNVTCDMRGYCNCGEQGCSHGSCNLDANVCVCSVGWAGDACDVCASGFHGPLCLPCSDQCNEGCDDGLEGTGQCHCSECERNPVTTIAMTILCGATLVVSAFAFHNARLASKQRNSQVHAETYTMSVFLFASLLSRSVILAIDIAANTAPRFDTIMELVMDVPALVDVSMLGYFLLHALTVVRSRPVSVVVFSAPRSPLGGMPTRSLQAPQPIVSATPCTSLLTPSNGSPMSTPLCASRASSFLSLRQSLGAVVCKKITTPRTREFTHCLVFFLLLLFTVCIPVILSDGSSDEIFMRARYVLWACVYVVLTLLFWLALATVAPRSSLSEIFWTRPRLLRVCRTGLAVAVLRCALLIVSMVLSYKDLVRPSLSGENGIFMLGYYLLTYLVPAVYFLSIMHVEPLRYSVVSDELSSCFIPPRLLSIENHISAGSTGAVLSGRLLDLAVACKQQRVYDLRTLNEVVNEATLLIHLRHPNVVAFYGLCLNHPHCYLVTELCDFSLASVIECRQLCNIKRTDVLLGICDGMAYLHKKNLIHRDLKPENVLLQGGVAKICDFGTATMFQSANALTTRVGTPLFMAPEVLSSAEHTTYTRHVDVFSFGVMLWCVCCGRVPYANEVTTNVWDLVRRVQGGLRPSREEAGIVNDALWCLMSRCWHAEVNQRPEFETIKQELEQIFNDDENALPPLQQVEWA